jgi:hypothetical protein
MRNNDLQLLLFTWRTELLGLCLLAQNPQKSSAAN